jgi:hypothetical protein
VKAILFLLMLASARVYGAEEDGFVSLFNGNDLSNWVNVNCAPETWTVNDGMIHCTGHPTGALRTPREYENFILELDWRHLSSGGNSGVFIWASPIAAPGVPFLRGIEVQVLDNGFNIPGKNEWYTTHGDVFPIHGATMKPLGRHHEMRSFPSEERSKGTPEWNHYRIVCQNGVIRLHVNGKAVSGGEECDYRKGYLGLESEGGPIDFRNLRIKELPSSGAPAELSAPEDAGWHSLFTGLDLRGWSTNGLPADQWSVRSERLRLQAGLPDAVRPLWTDGRYGAAEFVVDCRPAKTKDTASPAVPILYWGNPSGPNAELRLDGATPDTFQRFLITAKPGEVIVRRGDSTIGRLPVPRGFEKEAALGLGGTGGAIEFMNVYIRELQ